MIGLSEKHTIITLKNKGLSNREIHRTTGIDRKTVARHWRAYLNAVDALGDTANLLEVQERIIEKPCYDSSKRKPVKYSPEIDAALECVLSSELEKLRLLGPSHKQKLTGVQIHQELIRQGFDIGLTTVTEHIRKKRNKAKEAFIRQHYPLGSRLEYDFGEVKLEVASLLGTYHLAVLASPGANYRYAYLYENQKKEVFIDSHVRFFKMVGGVYGEVVYDNMKNVVSRFIGRGEKQLNEDLLKMSSYYGFAINVTNCFAGNEKGYVESSVKWVRNKVFATEWRFDSLEQAREYLACHLEELNKPSLIEEEKLHLMRPKPPLEIAAISQSKVDKYSFIRLENSWYSVPDYLVGYTLTAKTYVDTVIIFSGRAEVCRHKRQTTPGSYSVDIFHYLKTLMRKPGAVKNSVALSQQTQLKELFEAHYTTCPKEFVAKLTTVKDRPLGEIIEALSPRNGMRATFPTPLAENVYKNTKQQLAATSAALLGRGEKVAG